ncbi:MAG: hypothetical protein J1E85_07065 [Ruminococcus sp.]|nr:hypothetical protein [Ruminococcus sp.]
MKKLKISKFIAVISAVGIIAASSVIGANAAVVDNSLSVSSDFKNTDILVISNTNSGLPSKYSSVDLGYVTNIKNQGSNDCWAYAGVATFESKLLRDGFNVGNMSATWANVWATTKLNGKGWQRDFNSEGYNYIIPGYLTSWYGGILESDIDPVDLKGDIYGDMAPANLARYGTTSIRYLSKSNPNEIKQAIMDNGGVYTGYAQTVNCMNNNLSYFMPEDYSGSYVGHAVEIVGWDDNYSRMQFGTTNKFRPKNNGAWLVRNSWGNYNSLGGYFWISYEDKYIFDSRYNPSFTIEEFMEITDDVKLKQNEIYGATYEFQYVVRDKITYINKFDFSDNYNIIDKVVFETQSVGADYEIYYIPVENEVPDNDENNWIKLDSGKVEFSGYICADFEDFSAPVGDGAIAVKIDTTDLNEGKDYTTDPSYVINSIGVGEWLRTSSGVYTFINDSKHGDCFIKYDKKMRELLDWYKYAFEDDLGGTFVIKAVTRENIEDDFMLGDVNLDGTITIDDVTLAQKYIANMVDLSKQAQKNADVDKNSKIDINDVTTIQKYIAGIYEW